MGESCKVIEIVTPKKFILHGLWFGVEKPKKVIVFVHGLTSNAFSNHKFVVPLAGKNTAVVTFSSRGHDIVSKLKKIDRRKKKGYSSVRTGAAHEIFTECVDDIEGVANFVRKKGIKDIYLVGHSTGCQKCVYYLSKKGKQRCVKGVVLLCPLSDYSTVKKLEDSEKLKKAEKEARRLVKSGKPHSFMPEDLWGENEDAQRFLSLYTPDSEEEIFTYASCKKPVTFQKVKIPMFLIFAGDDEYHDRATKKIAEWFKENSKSRDLRVEIVEGALHSFQGCEGKLVQIMNEWIGT